MKLTKVYKYMTFFFIALTLIHIGLLSWWFYKVKSNYIERSDRIQILHTEIIKKPATLIEFCFFVKQGVEKIECHSCMNSIKQTPKNDDIKVFFTTSPHLGSVRYFITYTWLHVESYYPERHFGIQIEKEKYLECLKK